MKKAKVLFFLLFIIMLAGCGKDEVGESDSPAVEDTNEEISMTDVETETADNETETKEEINSDDFRVVTDEGTEWSGMLRQDGILTADINQDGQNDVIRIVSQELEGSLYITEFAIELGGDDTVYSLENEYYDASFEKLEWLDMDCDGSREVLFLFDTHGGGGQGTHDIMMFSDKELVQISSSLEPAVEIENGAYLDDIYYIEKVLYGEEEKLLVRQYMYGEDGHSDGIGDVVSIVSLDSDTSSLIADVSWIENY